MAVMPNSSSKTDPKREAQGIQGDRLFRTVVEAAPNAMVMINRKGEITMVNAQAERVLRAGSFSELVRLAIRAGFLKD
jgi:PAS domain-containing protein